MKVEEIIQEAESILAEDRRVRSERQSIERLMLRESLVNACFLLVLCVTFVCSVFGAVVVILSFFHNSGG